MFYLAGIVLAVFLSVLLITKKGRIGADLILSVWLLFIGVHLSFYYAFFISKNYSLPHLLGLELPLPLVHGPFLYVYTVASTREGGNMRPLHLIHFLPFLLSYLLFKDFYRFEPSQKIFVYEHSGEGFEGAMAILAVAYKISGAAYVLASLWRLRKHKQAIRMNFSSIDKITLTWLTYLIYGIGIIWIFVLARMEIFTFGAVVVFVFFLGYFGIRQVGIFSQRNIVVDPSHSDAKGQTEMNKDTTPVQESLNDNRPRVVNSSKKYIRSGLNTETAAEIHKALQAAMNNEKLFTNSELSLADLADHLGVHPNNLSQVINTFENKNFYDYVNFFRIEEFKRVVSLSENRKFTLLAIAHDCGFNSKTSFNRNFKIVTGQSPSAYLKAVGVSV